MEYRRNAPYDAFGDYSVFVTEEDENDLHMQELRHEIQGETFREEGVLLKEMS